MNNTPVNIEENFLKPMHRHFINLTCSISDGKTKEQNNGMPDFRIFSAFIVEIDSEWLAITAGHIFNDLKEAKANGAIISDWHIDDSIVSNRHEPACPYSLDIDRDVFSLYENADVTGVDYAFFKIYDLARQAISTRGIQAIPSAVWSANDISEYSIWLLIGTPSNGRDLKNKQVHKFYATIGLESRGGPARLDSICHFLSGSLALNAYAAFSSLGRLS